MESGKPLNLINPAAYTQTLTRLLLCKNNYGLSTTSEVPLLIVRYTAGESHVMRDTVHGCYFCDTSFVNLLVAKVEIRTNNSSGLVVGFSHGHFNQTAKDMDIHGSIGEADRALQS